MRSYKRSQLVDKVDAQSVLDSVGLSKHQVEEMYRYLAIANYEDRFVIPTAHREEALKRCVCRAWWLWLYLWQ